MAQKMFFLKLLIGPPVSLIDKSLIDGTNGGGMVAS